MSTLPEKVPFGYIPPKHERKGTLIYYDSFENTSEQELDFVAEFTEQRSFAKLVLYPLHEQTVRRMTKEPVSAYYKREDKLQAWKSNEERYESLVAIERLDGKRKKYTPIDVALRHLTEHYSAPHFLLLQGITANQFASYQTFEDWIERIRLLILIPPNQLHPKLIKYEHRWEAVH